MTTTQTPAVPFQVPARELAVDDVISMGKISHVDLKDTYVALRFHAKCGEHGTAFPLDLMVTVLSRRTDPIDPAADPAQDYSSPLLMTASALKPGMALINRDGRTASVVYQATVMGSVVKVDFVGDPAVELDQWASVEVTRLSAMAVYHARSEWRVNVGNQLRALVQTWNVTADQLVTSCVPESSPLLAADQLAEARTRRDVAEQVQRLLDCLRV